ncbi:MAG: 2-oxoacid:acceptor oxidoreductase family protein [Planctomycetota bacterium]|jgi:pyruvate ferredoxin oxidoreductase gamma subunit|nr:2-oxoacid:acceptor oxidoreductase family protein [Planctomycetota bacterium]MDP7131187.1 2-oxoacid:acceptor oxidoreductase family protein [Planctomycetota bacterium]
MNKNKSSADSDRFFEIRFESIGGLGAHAAGQVLAAAAVLRMDMNGAHFSSYGSEKKGSVVRSFVRLGPANKPIRTSAPVESPHVIVVFHSALIDHPATIAGLQAEGTLIYNSADPEPPASLAQLPATARVIRLDALRIAVEEKSRPNAVLLGTLSAAFPFLEFDVLLEALSDEFASKHPEAVASNERAFRRGAEEFEIMENVGQAEGDLPIMRPGPVWGYETAPLGGVLPTPGNTVWNDLTVSRAGWLPVLDKEGCIRCGICDMVCPDLCLVWSTDPEGSVHLDGVDYRYCKGCLRCVETCPTGAMTREIETPGLADDKRVPLFPGFFEQNGEAND